METIKAIFGTENIPLVLAGYLWGFVGVVLSLYWSIKKRNKKSPRSPEAFSWSFFWSDNAQRLIVNALALAVLMRFSHEILGKELTVWGAAVIGFNIDRLLNLLKNLAVK
jgi:hypothetical protein